MPSPTYTTIYETVHGSTAYGLDRPGSDVDLKGVVVGPSAWYFGYQKPPEQIDVTPDHVLYEVRKFVRLASQANPTLIEVLWTAPRFHTVVTAAGERLVDARAAFLSKRIKDSFSGYAVGQLKRIRTHRKWLLEPPTAAPTRADYGLPDRSLAPKDQLGAAQALNERGDLADQVSANFLHMLERERAYRAARAHFKQYQHWLKHRNPQRAALEAAHGYDTKHAMHLVRLLRMALEITSTGEVSVQRDDRDELLAVRDGAWSYDQLIEHADGLKDAVDAATKDSPLPDEVDHDALQALCVSLVDDALRAEQ